MASQTATFVVGGFAKVLDLKHRQFPESVGIYGRVAKIDGEKVQLVLDPNQGHGHVIERDISQLEPHDKGSVPLIQLQGMGISLHSLVPEVF